MCPCVSARMLDGFHADRPEGPERGAEMSFENLMGEIARLGVATDTLAAIGARLALGEGGLDADPDVVAALEEVLDAAGVADLDAMPPPQRAAALALSRLLLAQATD